MSLARRQAQRRRYAIPRGQYTAGMRTVRGYQRILSADPAVPVLLQLPKWAGRQILFQDPACTIPVEDPGDPIGGVRHPLTGEIIAVQTTDADRPVWGGVSVGAVLDGGQWLELAQTATDDIFNNLVVGPGAEVSSTVSYEGYSRHEMSGLTLGDNSTKWEVAEGGYQGHTRKTPDSGNLQRHRRSSLEPPTDEAAFMAHRVNDDTTRKMWLGEQSETSSTTTFGSVDSGGDRMHIMNRNTGGGGSTRPWVGEFRVWCAYTRSLSDGDINDIREALL